MDISVKPKIKSGLTCYHCGDPCNDKNITLEDKNFCCEGCKMVYNILEDNDLCNYYHLESFPGIKTSFSGTGNQFEYLDNPDIEAQLLNFSEGCLKKVKLHIPSIHCSSCIWLLENLPKINKGIYSSRVNFINKDIDIDFNPEKTTLRGIVELLTSIGYKPVITLTSGEETEKDNSAGSENNLLLKIGIAGFCFGNIMLLSFPEYLGFEVEQDFIRYFSWFNFILALPVLFYCSSDYFISAAGGLRKKFVNIDLPIVIGILTLFVRSSYEIFSQTGSGYFDSFAGLLFFLLIGKWFQQRTYRSLSFERDYRSFFPISITRLNNNKKENIPLSKLQKGDTILVRNEEIIPADSMLISNYAEIDYSFVTGESDPVLKIKGDQIFAGGKIKGSLIKLKTLKPVSQSYLTGLWNTDNKSNDYWSSTTRSLVNSISKYFTVAVLSIAFITAFYWSFNDPELIWNSFTAVLIVACPCALALVTPFTLGSSMNIFGKNNFYLKNAEVIEKLGQIDHIVFDKTGTITESTRHPLKFHGVLTEEDRMKIKSLVINSMHPYSRKLAEHLNGVSYKEIDNFTEIPGKGLLGYYNGEKIMLGSSDYVYGNDTSNKGIFLKIGNAVKGFYELKNRYRKNLKELIKDLQSKYTISLLSGDHNGELKNLKNIFPENSRLLFNQKPDDKLKYIDDLDNRGVKTLMVGDGLNDAIALGKSHAGVVISDDLANFTPASDGILKGSKLNKLSKFLAFSITSRKIIVAGFILSFLYNIIGLSFAVTGNLTPMLAAILMPLSSISIVVFSTASVNVLARRKGLN